MEAREPDSIIRRKVRMARDGGDPRLMSPSRALRLALAQAADAVLGLGLNVAMVEQRRVSLAAAPGALGEEGLLMLLDGASDARAALRLDPQFLAAVIHVLTTGTVRADPVRARPSTATDAALVAPLAEAVLERFDAHLADTVASHQPRGFRFGDRVEDARGLALALSAPDYDLFSVTADLGPGARTGRFDLLLPVAEPVCAAPKRPDSAAGESGLAEVALDAPVVLDAILARLPLSLGDLWTLRPGQVLPVARTALGDTELLGARGHRVARVRLGQLNGWRAVRLLAPAGEGLPEVPADPVQTDAPPPRLPDAVPA